MALVGFQYQVCFNEKQDTFNTREKSRKSHSVTEWCRCEKCGVMDTNVKCLSFGEVKALEYFQ